MFNGIDITITVHGKEHKGKTSLIAVLNKLLTDAGVDVVLAHTDHQLDEKIEHIDTSLERIKGSKVFINETHSI